MQSRPLISTCAAVAVLLILNAPAIEATCADCVVKARGHWRAQVRAMPALGPLYANWSIAAAADYACAESSTGYSCKAIARPCRD